MSGFNSFPKVPRLNREVIVTEKIDGTNGQIYISFEEHEKPIAKYITEVGIASISAGSRNRWVTPDNDNYGFAKWVQDNFERLYKILGEGRHFGEWYGQGIQRGYGLDSRRFALFNVARWAWLNDKRANDWEELECVPILWTGLMSELSVPMLANTFGDNSRAVWGFPNPEGFMVFHVKANQIFKYTYGNDGHKDERS